MVNLPKIPLYFVGFGDFALELLADWEGFHLSRTHYFAGFFDDDRAKTSDPRFRGAVSKALELPDQTSLVLAAASPAFRREWMMMRISNFNFPNLIHQRTRIGEKVGLGMGNIISEGCILTTDITLGDFNMLNHYVTIGHHCQMGSGNALMTKAHLSGRCVLGSFNLLGVGSSMLQGKSMGDGNILAPHACLMHHTSNQQRLMGVPALGQNIG